MGQRASRSQWRDRVDEWQHSGLTAGEFASRNGLKAPTLGWWKWRLGRDEREAARDSVRGYEQAGAAAQPAPAVTFVEVDLDGHDRRRAPRRSAAAGPAMELVVGLHTLRLGELTSDALNVVLDVLEGR